MVENVAARFSVDCNKGNGSRKEGILLRAREKREVVPFM